MVNAETAGQRLFNRLQAVEAFYVFKLKTKNQNNCVELEHSQKHRIFCAEREKNRRTKRPGKKERYPGSLAFSSSGFVSGGTGEGISAACPLRERIPLAGLPAAASACCGELGGDMEGCGCIADVGKSDPAGPAQVKLPDLIPPPGPEQVP
ncbi:hypothetical protein KIL84_021073 [Mauremys mutica]|uniref:Uncharacterized protein n=1 Tax=Mauremys mutica TaxID=74926 RepID=A0A9D4B0I1_9SAUR|nr:hypothetical protein KIL84_021073 [Mauremys mutica]